jgi:hypothetical protein
MGGPVSVVFVGKAATWLRPHSRTALALSREARSQDAHIQAAKRFKRDNKAAWIREGWMEPSNATDVGDLPGSRLETWDERNKREVLIVLSWHPLSP